MTNLDLKNPRYYLTAGLVIVFSCFALWLRLIPMFNMGTTDILSMVAMDDPMYNLRQVEIILVHFPGYAWFDPMTLYPYGTSVYWGPLFPTIIAACCLITGAATRPEIISISLLVPPVMGALVVILMYFAGRVFGDWKTGLLASGFTAVVSSQFYSISLFGYIDHHIAEVLFSTLFCIAYSYAVFTGKDTKIDCADPKSYQKTLFLAFLAGVCYLLGLFAMPTMILFALIVGIFTVIQGTIDIYRNRTCEYLLVINVTVFLISIIGLLLFGLKNSGIALSTYSIGHVYAYLGLIGGTILVYGCSYYLKGKEKFWYPVLILGCAAGFTGILYLAAPPIYDLLISSLFAFFGQQAITNTVIEARGWSLSQAWYSFNYGLILFAGGILVMLYNNMKDEHPHQVFALIWSLVIFISTWQHVRYEYYLAVTIALMSAVFVSFIFGAARSAFLPVPADAGDFLPAPGHGEQSPSPQKKRRHTEKTRGKTGTHSLSAYALLILALLAAGTGILFAWTSVSNSYTHAVHNPYTMNADWKESLEWMGNNTPQTGVDYFDIYDPATFHYPETSYGVMSWWDYGHMITYISKRIPNANPFQQGVAGPNGAAAFFMAESEEPASRILDYLGTRYVITDIDMDSTKFPAMATWYNASRAEAPYMMRVLVPTREDPNSLESQYLNTRHYYQTMVSRLHNFDGSMTPATTVYYVEYVDPDLTNLSLPVVAYAELVNASFAKQKVEKFNLDARPGYHAVALNMALLNPVDEVPALRHYRLVHESPTNIFNAKTPDVKYVKVFEYVKGAHIKGTGIIELDLVSNTGRPFTYRQASENGEFIVPFSTAGNPYGVVATGKYRIRGTGREFDVPESAVLDGSPVN